MPDSDEANSFCAFVRLGVRISAPETCFRQFKKKRFFTFFYSGHVFTFFNVFLFSKRFFIFKNVGKVQSGKQINKKHFQNNSNETDLSFSVACRMT